MSDPWTAAWEEAEASVPPDVKIYSTLELQHPSFVNGSPDTAYVVRVITGVAEDTPLTIEIGADFNGGEEVTFQAVQFFAERPELAEGTVPSCTITIDNVARYLTPILENALEYKADLIVLYREYRSDDTTEPCYGPIEFVIKKVTVRGTQVSGIAMIDNLGNKKFPTRVFTITEFPGLM